MIKITVISPHTCGLQTTIYINPHSIETIATDGEGDTIIFTRWGSTFHIADHTPESLAKLVTESKNATKI